MTQHQLYRSLAAALWLFSSNSMANVSYPDLFPPLEGTKATTVLDDVPGCACQGWWCKEEEKTQRSYSDEEMDHVAMCPFLGTAYGFFDVLPSESICDALETSDEFRSFAGDVGNPDDNPRMIGSYYNVGKTLIRVESGNCNSAYQRQQDCTMEPSNYYSAARWYSPHPTNCQNWGFRLPTTNSTLAVTPACLSSFQAVDSPHDDRWFLYASWEKDDDNDGIDFCRGDIDSVANGAEYRTAKLEARTAGLLQNRSSYPYFPIMGREDWIEPVEGRRYMGYDFVDDQEEANEYCLTVLHLGYESCNGYPTEASSSVNSSETSIVAMLLTFGVLALLIDCNK
jgi:hypothetical protein